MATTRQEHLEHCKEQALKELEFNEGNHLENAVTSMCSDLGKHPETQNHAGIQLGMSMLMCGMLRTETEVREFINGFN